MSNKVEIYQEMMVSTCLKHTLNYVCDNDLVFLMEISMMQELRFDQAEPFMNRTVPSNALLDV